MPGNPTPQKINVIPSPSTSSGQAPPRDLWLALLFASIQLVIVNVQSLCRSQVSLRRLADRDDNFFHIS